jgi:bifunctional DNA-binding transcriptional regulator/antitoxin component of YhaV-PrlF toxin-antitoxin module
MNREFARLRERNQLTLPSDVVERLGLKLNDLVEFSITNQGQVELRAAKIVTAGTPEAFEELQAAKEDIAQGRYTVIENLEQLTKHVEKLRKGERPSAEKSKPALTEAQRKDVEAVVQTAIVKLLHNLVAPRPIIVRNEEAVERGQVR